MGQMAEVVAAIGLGLVVVVWAVAKVRAWRRRRKMEAAGLLLFGMGILAQSRRERRNDRVH
jgi:hypothetical protein